MPKSGVEHLAQHPGWKTKSKVKPKPQPKPYVLIVVSGGVAEVVQGSHEVDVDILDFDNLECTGEADANLSDQEWEYLKENNPDLYEFFAPSREKDEDEG